MVGGILSPGTSLGSYEAIEQTDSEDGESIKDGGEADGPLTLIVVVQLITCFLAIFAMGMGIHSVGYTLIDLREIASMTIAQSGFLLVSKSLGAAIGSVLVKPVLQRFRYELVLFVSLGMHAITSVFIPTSGSMIVMIFLFAGLGVAVGFIEIAVWHICILLGGKKRSGMFLQLSMSGTPLAGIVGPFMAEPFLSSITQPENVPNRSAKFHSKSDVDGELLNQTTFALWHNMTTNATTRSLSVTAAAETHVQYFYIIVAAISCVPAIISLLLYINRDTVSRTETEEKRDESLELTIPLTLAILLLFLHCFFFYGVQESCSNFLMTFAAFGPLKLSKTTGVYLTSVFWIAMCSSRFNGIWLAKVLTSFKILLIDSVVGAIASIILILFAAKYVEVLWVFTAVLGFALGSMLAASVAWASEHLPENNYILSMVNSAQVLGQMGLPLVVASLYDIYGATVLMYAMLIGIFLATATLLISQGIVIKYGNDGKLPGRSQQLN